jgi:hypothetical protein
MGDEYDGAYDAEERNECFQHGEKSILRPAVRRNSIPRYTVKRIFGVG